MMRDLKSDSRPHPPPQTDAPAAPGEWMSYNWQKTSNMPAVGATLAEAFGKLMAAGKVHTSNVVTCENWIDPAADLLQSLFRFFLLPKPQLSYYITSLKNHLSFSQSFPPPTGMVIPERYDA